MNKTHSPITTTKTTLSFTEAIEEMINGKRITKLEWGNPDEYCMLRNGQFQIHTKGEWHTWIISDGDALGVDWMVME